MSEVDISLEVLPTGEVRFKRGDAEHNAALMSVLSDMFPERITEFEDFFKGSEDIVVLEGDTIFCG
jgi:hypothetical protein